ncbi:hypothetical protein GCM10017556_17070 [Micromonospora sagamiensis]|nr:hypothetical protein GCM10017556_17070 [Micromonospora sagamiensis]
MAISPASAARTSPTRHTGLMPTVTFQCALVSTRSATNPSGAEGNRRSHCGQYLWTEPGSRQHRLSTAGSATVPPALASGHTGVVEREVASWTEHVDRAECP